jgi:hypothetical protein
VKVWSEREPGAWTECSEAAYLMALLAGGFDRFPLGAYTDAERDALDAAIGFDREGGGNMLTDVDAGSLARYGVRLRPLADGTRAGLRWALEQPDRALVVTGTFRGLPAGHVLRRWQPGFIGGHAWTVLPDGAGAVLWLDPLAPDDHPGDKATVDDVMACAWTPGAEFGREAVAGEFAPEATRLQRLSVEVLAWRKLLPDAAAAWHQATGMVPNYGGPLWREMRLAAVTMQAREIAPQEVADFEAWSGLGRGELDGKPLPAEVRVAAEALYYRELAKRRGISAP